MAKTRKPEKKRSKKNQKSKKIHGVKLKELTLADVIETLIHYDVEHCRFPHNYLAEFVKGIPELGGWALDDKKLILINKEECDERRREIVIHELLHTVHFRRGDLPRDIKKIEEIVEAETELVYKKLYGNKP